MAPQTKIEVEIQPTSRATEMLFERMWANKRHLRAQARQREIFDFACAKEFYSFVRFEDNAKPKVSHA